MSVKLLAENILQTTDFLSATQQEGRHIGQPAPSSSNSGAFRLLSKGDIDGSISDFSYDGTATGNGAADGSTVVDSVLSAFGNDYFIGGTVVLTGIQDEDDYTEQDPSLRIVALGDALIVVTDLDNDEEAWLVIDKGAAYFDGDFEFHVDMRVTDSDLDGEECAVWGLANAVDTFKDIDDASGDFLSVKWRNVMGIGYIELSECVAGSVSSDLTSALSCDVWYYLKIVRDESVGANGTLYCYVYSDASHTTLIETISRTLNEKEDFRYLYWVNSYQSGSGGVALDIQIANLEIISDEVGIITDFAQSTGTITVSPSFDNQVIANDTFTLTVAYSSREFLVELTAGGDTGDATFKWSHDGGTIYFGRDDPDQATWLAETTVSDDHRSGIAVRPAIVQAANGNLICIHEKSGGGDDVVAMISTDKGLTWVQQVMYADVAVTPHLILIPSNGRLACFAGDGSSNSGLMYYSDDHGESWTTVDVNTFIDGATWAKFAVLANGNIACVYEGTNVIYFSVSSDGGFTWSTEITIASDANSQEHPSVCQAKNGDIICAYTTDEDSVGVYEIKCKISSDGGQTWSSAIDVIDESGGLEYGYPDLLVDVSGDIFCFAEELANHDLVMVKSTDSGTTWAAAKDVHAPGHNCQTPNAVLVDGHDVIVAYTDDTNDYVMTVRRGMWELFSAGTNDCPCAIEVREQELICDAGIIWHGGAGIVEDVWSFEPEYDFAMSNMISDSPSKCWRSEQDNVDCRIVIDMGTNERLLIDGVGFFNCNVRTSSFQMNVADSWGSPLVDESITFDLVTGLVDYVTGNAVEDDSLLGNYDDHYFSDDYYLRMTSGTDEGETWKILDNVGGYIFLDTTVATNIAASDTFVVFQGWTAKTFTNNIPYRFISINIEAQKTAEGYYKIGFVPIGKTVTLDRRWTGEYENPHVYNIDLLETPQGGLVPIKHAERYREFGLVWPFSENTRKQLISLLDYTDRKNICLIPDDSSDNQNSGNCFIECYLVKLVGQTEQTDGYNNRLDITLRFREVL